MEEAWEDSVDRIWSRWRRGQQGGESVTQSKRGKLTDPVLWVAPAAKRSLYSARGCEEFPKLLPIPSFRYNEIMLQQGEEGSLQMKIDTTRS